MYCNPTRSDFGYKKAIDQKSMAKLQKLKDY